MTYNQPQALCMSDYKKNYISATHCVILTHAQELVLQDLV